MDTSGNFLAALVLAIAIATTLPSHAQEQYDPAQPTAAGSTSELSASKIKEFSDGELYRRIEVALDDFHGSQEVGPFAVSRINYSGELGLAVAGEPSITNQAITMVSPQE